MVRVMEADPAVFGKVENNIFEGSLLVIVTSVSSVDEAGADIEMNTDFSRPWPRVAPKPLMTGGTIVAAKLPPVVGLEKPLGAGTVIDEEPVLTATKLAGRPPVVFPAIITMGVEPVSEPPLKTRLLELIVPTAVTLLATGTCIVKPPRTC